MNLFLTALSSMQMCAHFSFGLTYCNCYVPGISRTEDGTTNTASWVGLY